MSKKYKFNYSENIGFNFGEDTGPLRWEFHKQGNFIYHFNVNWELDEYYKNIRFYARAQATDIKYYFGNGDLADDETYKTDRSSKTNWSKPYDVDFAIEQYKEWGLYPHTKRHLHISIYSYPKILDNKVTIIDIIVTVSYDFTTPNAFEWVQTRAKFLLKVNWEFTYETDTPPIDPIIPKNIEDPNANKWQFYIDYQKQPWFNKLLNAEEVNLLPIETKKYNFLSILNTINELTKTNFALQEIIINDKFNNEILAHKINIPIILKINDSNNDYLLNKYYINEIFSIVSGENEESNEKFDDMYYYLVIKGNNKLKVNDITIDFSTQPNTWFIIPINQIGLTSENCLGSNNTFKNLKNISEQNISSFFTSPLSPLQIAFFNRDNILKLFGCLPSKTTGPVDFNTLCGFYLWDNFLVIPITEEVIKIWIEKNLFINKTFKYLKNINDNVVKFPTIWQNEPILYSPQMLITYVKSINNNFNPIGNDLFDLRYQILYIGLITTMLANNTVMLHTNHFNPLRVLSMSKNELCTTINGELPYKTNAWANWLDTHQTTQDTSYKIYNLTANQRKDNYDTQNYMKMMGMIGSGISSMTNIALTAMTGGMGVSGAIGANFLKKLPQNIASGTLEKMENARGVGNIAQPSMGLVGNLLFGGLCEAKRRDNALRQMETNNKIDKLNLDSQFENIKMSSGKDFILPSFQSGAFAQDSGFYLYTLEAKLEYKKQIGLDRLMNGVPVNQILNYINYDNRSVYNILAINGNFNYNSLYNIIKEGLVNNKIMSKFNREYIDYFISNYLSGVTIFKNYKDWIPQHWKIENNYENDVFEDEDNLDDDN